MLVVLLQIYILSDLIMQQVFLILASNITLKVTLRYYLDIISKEYCY